MRPSIFRFISAGACAFALASPGRAEAQSCCAGASALTPARLALHEDALVGLQLKASNLYGSFDGERRFFGASEGATELNFEQDLAGSIRVFKRGQLSAILPMVETYRSVPGLSEVGGDLGDLQLGARWDFTVSGSSVTIPGIALAVGATLPTGRAPEASSKPLATDATGIGAFQGSLALALEQTYGPWLVNVTGVAAWRAPRTVGDIHAQQGVQIVASAAGGYSFPSGPVLALTLAYTAELDATINGETLPGSGRAATRIGLAGGLPFNDLWRMQGSVTTDLPIRYFGFNQPASVGLTLMILRSWS
ncbi:MAG: transporter [Byssovorax sp.]